MKNTKTLFRFYTLFEYEEEEAFLEKQHKEGWKVVSFKLPGLYKFEKCEPEDMVYRIDFTNENGSKNTEYQQMFADNGWDFLWSVNGFSIFRKPLAANTNDNSNEIFSDNSSRLQMLQKIQQRRLLPLVTIFLCAVVPNFIKGINGDFGSSIFDNIFTVFFGLMFVLYTYVFIKSLSKIKKLKEKLQ
ncbi:Protein of unknown function [Treponema bryantii]|uniref:DUF2812 domain-containing protein n=1 Tax=Treponema bryantii TaxID=163 RepID=A0A1I3J439_9SPIR|nr:DUF2812 domain-containing protein [Treponema bryantii]SFI54963.1 Protein of unknown function [Treponema bryantii]